MKYIYFATGMMLLAGIFQSCKKDKSDYYYDNRPITDVRNNSAVRIVNLSGNNQVIANGDTLTNYKIVPPGATTEESLMPGTKYFPENGRIGTVWSIPRELLKNGKATLKVENRSYNGLNEPVDFDVEETYNDPADYYLLRGLATNTGSLPQVMKVPRSVTAPAKAGYFKIRILNLASLLKPQNSNEENVALPLSLTWADGTPVSEVTNAIAPGLYSEYIEVPYGTYQFKVLTPQGTAVTAAGGNNSETTDIIDPETSTLVKPSTGRPHTVSTNLTYAPVRTYQPGGIYTIVVSENVFAIPYYNGNPGETVDIHQNGFRIIADITEPLNNTYVRLQAVHTLPGERAVTVKINGQSLATLAYASHSDYSTYVYGDSKIEAVNADGKILASVEMQLSAGLNYTAWVYQQPDGKPGITVVSNNLSGTYSNNNGQGQDGTYAVSKQDYPFHIRFLNLCKDLPYVSFTSNDGQAIQGVEATHNLEPGKVPVQLPYARFTQQQSAYQLMAFRSSPGVYPGNWITSIPVLNSTDFIARKELYVRGALPVHEPGVFSVALIGQSENAKMIIVKHTK